MPFPDLAGRSNLIAGFIAYSCCFEYDMAIENGLRMAKRHNDLQAKDNDNQIQITRQKAKVIFNCIKLSVKDVKDSFPAKKLDDEAKFLLENTKPQDERKYGKPYSYFPDLTMQTTTLNENYHPIAALIIKEVFEHHQTAIEKGKKEAMVRIGQMDNVNLDLVLQELYNCIGKSCLAVCIDIDALLQKNEFQACFPQAYIANPVTNGAESSFNTEERNTMPPLSNPKTNSISCLFENVEESESDTSNAHSYLGKPTLTQHIDLTLEEDEDDDVRRADQQNHHEIDSSRLHLEGNRKRTRTSQFTGNYREDSDDESEEEARTRLQRKSFRKSGATPSLEFMKADLGARDLTAPLMNFEE